MLIKYFLGHKKALTLCGGALVIALTLYPMFYRTWAFGSDAWGLSVIAILDPEEVPWSPSDFNSLAIRPAVAYWLLTNFDWPYERCGKAMTAMDGCSQPLVNFVGTTLDTHEPDSIMTRRGYGLLRHLMREIEASNKLNLKFVVSGSHLSQRDGMTIEEIETDGFKIDAKVGIFEREKNDKRSNDKCDG